MGMHSDDEAELGPAPAIASVSFGAERAPLSCAIRALANGCASNLTDGSLLLMAGSLQQHWSHGINKTAKPLGARVNLTFRTILGA